MRWHFLERGLGVWLLVTAATSSMAAEGKPGAGDQPQYRVTRWTAENGLPQNSARALAQTPDGYLWIGTLYGLARFDGVRFTVFDHSNTPEMASDAINDLAADASDGSLWIATGNGLLHYHAHRFERFGAEQGIGEIGHVWPALGGGAWVTPEKGRLLRVQNGAVRAWKLGARNPTNEVRQLIHKDISEVLLLLASELTWLNLETGRLKPLDQPAELTYCRSFFEDVDGAVWVCSDVGLWRKDPKGWVQTVPGVLGKPPHPTHIGRTRDGQLWVIQAEAEKRNTLQRLVNGKLSPFASPGFPEDLNVTRLLEDHEGNLWVGSTEGLFQLRRVQVQVYSTRDGLKSDSIQSVTHGPDGTIWVGTPGFNGIREGRVFDVPPAPLNGERLWLGAILADSTGCFWFGSSGRHLIGFRNGNWTRLDAPADLEAGWRNPSALYEDRSRRIWIATGRSVACQERSEWRHYTITNHSPHGSVRVIHEDRRGDMWFGTYGGGLYRLHDEEMTSFRTALGNYNNRAWWIHEDADGVFWVGSQNGLNQFVPPGVEFGVPASAGWSRQAANHVKARRPAEAGTPNKEAEGRFFTFTTAHGLRENVVNNIQEDDFGYLWLSGLRGIYRVARKDLNQVSAGEKPEIHCVAYGEADGMLSSECNGGDFQPAGCKDELGRIWFPTTKGVAVIDPKMIRRNEVPPPVVIEQVIADDKVIYGDGVASGKPAANEVRLVASATTKLGPGSADVLKIHFTANSFAAAERIRFKYQLEGRDRNWRDAERDERMAVYTNLRPGHYRFRVKACNNHGYWSTTDALFAFSLAPHFWQTSMFYVLCALGIIGMAGAAHAYRLRWQRRLLKLEEQRALDRERTRIARDLHDDLGTALTGLALEMDVASRDVSATPPVARKLDDTAQHTRLLADRMREVVWAVNPRCDNVPSLAGFLEQQVGHILRSAGLAYRLELPDEIPDLPLDAEARHQLALCVREALTNVLRHARARKVVVSLMVEDNGLAVRIVDDGVGFDLARVNGAGNGLANLRERLERIGGTFECKRGERDGTVVTLHIPLKTPSLKKHGNQ